MDRLREPGVLGPSVSAARLNCYSLDDLYSRLLFTGTLLPHLSQFDTRGAASTVCSHSGTVTDVGGFGDARHPRQRAADVCASGPGLHSSADPIALCIYSNNM